MALCTPWVASAQIVIDDSPLQAKDVLSEASLVAYRKIPDEAIVKADPSGTSWVFSTSAILGSARSDPAVKASFGPKSASERDQVQAAVNAYKSLGVHPSTISASPVLVSYKGSTSKISQQIDAVAVGKILTLAADTNNVQNQRTSGRSYIYLDPSFVDRTKTIYKAISYQETTPTSTAYAAVLADTTKLALSDERVASSTLVQLGGIRFGIPIAYTARDKKLVLEPSVAKNYDVYWLEFAISPGEEAIRTVSDLFFLVTLQNSSTIALELVPLRYGGEQAVTEKFGTPEVSIEGKVTVGQIYEQTIEYKQLKPTILATGLHDAQFGWRLMDQMVDTSSKRLIAIVRVPKGTRELPLTMAVSGTIKQWYSFQSHNGTTDPQWSMLKLPN